MRLFEEFNMSHSFYYLDELVTTQPSAQVGVMWRSGALVRLLLALLLPGVLTLPPVSAVCSREKNVFLIAL